VIDQQILAVKCRLIIRDHHKVSEKTLAKLDAEIAELERIADERATMAV
jgi:hypothetical protein